MLNEVTFCVDTFRGRGFAHCRDLEHVTSLRCAPFLTCEPEVTPVPAPGAAVGRKWVPEHGGRPALETGRRPALFPKRWLRSPQEQYELPRWPCQVGSRNSSRDS